MLTTLLLPAFVHAFASSARRTMPKRSVLRMSTTASLPAPLAEAKIVDADGNTVDAVERLSGKSVALFFSASWCPMCTSFLPALRTWYEAVKASESAGDVEIIFVSSDRSDANFKSHFAKQGPWLAVPLDDEATPKLKRQYGAWAGSEIVNLGVVGRKSGVPAVVVINPDGSTRHYLNAERRGPACLKEWTQDLSETKEGLWP